MLQVAEHYMLHGATFVSWLMLTLVSRNSYRSSSELGAVQCNRETSCGCYLIKPRTIITLCFCLVCDTSVLAQRLWRGPLVTLSRCSVSRHDRSSWQSQATSHSLDSSRAQVLIQQIRFLKDLHRTRSVSQQFEDSTLSPGPGLGPSLASDLARLSCQPPHKAGILATPTQGAGQTSEPPNQPRTGLLSPAQQRGQEKGRILY